MSSLDTRDAGDGVLADVTAALDGEYRGARDVWRRIGRWSPRTIKSTLVAMSQTGRCEVRRVPITGGEKCEYRRCAATTDNEQGARR